MKKITSILFALVMVLNAVAGPATVKAVKGGAANGKIERVLSADQLAKAQVMAEKAKVADAQGTSVLRRAAKSAPASAKYQMASVKSFNGTQVVRDVQLNSQVKNGVASVAKVQNVTVSKDANGIITSVEGGEARVYVRARAFYSYVESQAVKYAYQSGNVNVIVDGNDFYIQDIICNIGEATWVKGTLNEDGTKLVVPAGQMIYWSTQGYGLTVDFGEYTESGWVKSTEDITYTVDGNTLTLDGAHAYVEDGYINFEDGILGAFWTADDSWAGYGEWSTVLTYDPSYVEPEKVLVELPAGAETEEWAMNATSVTSSSSTPIANQVINVAFVGSDVYVQGIFTNFKTAWVKGTKEGNTVTFKKFQYQGVYSTSYNIWFVGTDGQELTDATATIAADGKTLTFTESLLANAATDRIFYLTWLEDVVLSAGAPEEPTLTTLTAELPYANSFDTEAEQEEAAIYDANGDGSTFTFNAPSAGDNTTPAARYAYNSKNDGDDYVVFPGLTLEAGKSYKVALDARNNAYTEKFEVVCGTEAKASKLSTIVIAETAVNSSEYETFSTAFVPEADGVYYFAIHATSDADMYYLYCDNFAVSENNPAAPDFSAANANASATPAAEAKMGATIKFTAPSKTAGGDAITEKLAVIIKHGEATIDAPEATAGEQYSLDITEANDAALEGGKNIWTIQVSLNGVLSDVVSVSCWVGEDIPDDVEDLYVTSGLNKLSMEWTAPSAGQNDGILLPENLKYNVYPVEMIEFWGMTFPSIDYDNPLLTGLTETEASIEFATEEGDQTYAYVGVTVENSAGESDGTMGATLVGAPYELPLAETLAGGKLSYWWGADYDEYNYEEGGKLGIGELEDGYCFAMNAVIPGWMELQSGKIALAGKEAILSFDYMASAACELMVNIITPDSMDILETIEINPSEEMTTATLSLAKYKDAAWVRVTLFAYFNTTGGELAIANFTVAENVAKDLSLKISAPASMTLGTSATIKATVKNVGQETAENYSLALFLNGNTEAAPAPLFEYLPLAFMESATFEFEVESSVFDEAGNLNAKVVLTYAGDENAEDNEATATIELQPAAANPIENLAAEQTEEGLEITWELPETGLAEITEDFEAYEANTVYADGETCGPWSAVDNSQGYPYGWESSEINWDFGDAYAFGIMNFEEANLQNFEAISGSNVAIFMSEVDATSQLGIQSDKMMVSPELPGIAQTISFMAMPITHDYGSESFEVLASEDGKEWSLVKSFETEEEDWAEFSANLPEGTKYFAIHYISEDVFGLFIDDLKYTSQGAASPTGYNVYVDQNLVATLDGDALGYLYTEDLAAGEHEISVTALFGAKESAPETVKVGMAEGLGNVKDAVKAMKTVKNGNLVIIKNGVEYNVLGAQL